MKYNIKDYLILILFIVIIYLLFFQKENFTIDNDNTDNLYKDEINKQCDKITENINHILKATYDAVSNDDNFRFLNEDITFNNITVNDNLNVQNKLSLNGNIKVNKKYNYDNNIVTPLTELNVFPDYMIVAYNMIELGQDGKTQKATYNLPPGWVKCDGTEYYTFFDTTKNKTIGVVKDPPSDTFNIDTGKYDGGDSNGNIDNVYMTCYHENIATETNVNDVRRIKTPDLRGRFVRGVDPSIKNNIDSFVYKFNRDSCNSTNNFPNDLITEQPNCTDPSPTSPCPDDIILKAKGGQEYVKLTVDQISHNHLTHIGLESNSASTVYGKGGQPDISTMISINEQPNFFSFKFDNILSSIKTYYVITTSDYWYPYEKHDIPHPNIPPYYTLVYIMKIASEIILPS